MDQGIIVSVSYFDIFIASGGNMKLTPPKQFTFWLSAILFLIGLIVYTFNLDLLSLQPIWMVVAGYVILVLGNILSGL
jgi:membrane protein YdbS with pleckstrin-like domain